MNVVTMGLGVTYEFFNAAAPATEDLPARVPRRKRHHLVSLWIWLLVLFAFSVFGAAVFAEPTVTKIEEVIRLSQGSGL